MTITHGSLCSGIGLLDLGLHRAGIKTVWQVERDPFCRRVLSRHWPEVERYEDVKTVTNLTPVDLLSAGFPCQPVSLAGKGRAQKDERWLWPSVARVIDETKPKAVLIENVPGLLQRGLRAVLSDLARLGYDAEWETFSAFDVGAPHLRKRVFLVAADPMRVNVRLESGWLRRALEPARAPFDRHFAEALVTSGPDGMRRLEQAREFANERGWSRYCGWDFDPLARVDDGGAQRLVGSRRKALGNGVVVACAEAVGRAIVPILGEQ